MKNLTLTVLFTACTFAIAYGQKTSRTVIAYTGGQYAPIGVSIGSISNKGGFLFNARFSSSGISGETSIYEMTDADGLDDFYDWSYTGNTEYRRGSVTGCYVANVGGTTDGSSTHLMIGLGYGFANYYYEYEQFSSGGTSYGNEWVKYVDVSKESVEVEAGLLFDFKGFNLSVGYSSIAFEEGMITFGAGFSF
jgi:hypothetical protein